jgi:hypothetical protein
MKAIRLILLLPCLLLCQCVSPELAEHMPPYPIPHLDPRLGGVKPGDVVILLADRHAWNGYILKKEPAPGAMVVPAGTRLTIIAAGPGWPGIPPCSVLQVKLDAQRGFHLRLPIVNEHSMFPPSLLKAERIAIESTPKPRPIWAR